nr:hypothetical protein JVH1_0675 [Rhodococcus sp. JVH1]
MPRAAADPHALDQPTQETRASDPTPHQHVTPPHDAEFELGLRVGSALEFACGIGLPSSEQLAPGVLVAISAGVG